MSGELAVFSGGGELATTDQVITALVQRRETVKALMGQFLAEGSHYGKIPGCGDKPSLFQPGADALITGFRLVPKYRIEVNQLSGGHREYEMTCELYTPNGTLLGEGVGVASTMESKYRYRFAEVLCPECNKPTIRKSRQDKGGGWYCWAKIGGCGKTFPAGDPEIEGQERGKIDNPDIADLYNTVKKMAAKRAKCAAVITCTGTSDMFTQDLEDHPELYRNGKGAAPAETSDETPKPPRDEKPKMALKSQMEAIEKLLARCNVPDESRAKALEQVGLPVDQNTWTFGMAAAAIEELSKFANSNGGK